tara:strand:- start:148 stop:450 length:303 start_codon:yes stop_codon:yes gene_type:complete
MFRDYLSKPTIRKAYEIKEADLIKSVGESTSMLVSIHVEDTIKFKHYVPVETGDYVVHLTDSDVYHCPRSVFEARNILPAIKVEHEEEASEFVSKFSDQV